MSVPVCYIEIKILKQFFFSSSSQANGPSYWEWVRACSCLGSSNMHHQIQDTPLSQLHCMFDGQTLNIGWFIVLTSSSGTSASASRTWIFVNIVNMQGNQKSYYVVAILQVWRSYLTYKCILWTPLTLKSQSARATVTTYRCAKFHNNPYRIVLVIALTARQTQLALIRSSYNGMCTARPMLRTAGPTFCKSHFVKLYF